MSTAVVGPAAAPARADPSRSGHRLPGWLSVGLPVLVVAGALALRIPFYGQVNADYNNFLDPWYTYIKTHGGFAALKDQFANYNAPYLYLLALVTYLPIPKLIAIKSISLVFDLLLAFFGYRIVALKYTGWRPAAAAAALLAAPTVVVNSSYWGQCDAIYAAFTLGSMYFLLRRSPIWAGVFLGLAISFKLQAVFFLPVAFVILLLQRPGLRRILLSIGAVIGTFALLLVPALIAGAPLKDLLDVYPQQISGGGQTATAGAGRGSPAGGQASGGPGFAGQNGGGQNAGGQGFQNGIGQNAGGRGSAGPTNTLTRNAPSFYQWLPSNASNSWQYLGLTLTALAVAAMAGLAWFRRRTMMQIGPLLVLASATLIAVPFLLPGMHERYFYLADVFTIVTSFYVRRFWPIALLVQACSFVSYAPFLWSTTYIPLGVAAAGELVALVAAVVLFVLMTRKQTPTAARPVPATDEEPVPALG